MIIRTSCTCCAASDDGHGGAEEQQRESGQIAALFSGLETITPLRMRQLFPLVCRLTSHVSL